MSVFSPKWLHDRIYPAGVSLIPICNYVISCFIECISVCSYCWQPSIFVWTGNHVSVQITVSVHHPRSLPQCHFLGTSLLTSPLNACLAEKYEVSECQLVFGIFSQKYSIWISHFSWIYTVVSCVEIEWVVYNSSIVVATHEAIIFNSN